MITACKHFEVTIIKRTEGRQFRNKLGNNKCIRGNYVLHAPTGPAQMISQQSNFS